MNENTSQYSPVPVGTYWHGPKLGPLERACMYSMLDQGHPVTLFCHEKVEGVPEGVEIRDAREVTGEKKVVLYGHELHPALFSDQFRYHMIKQLGYLWLDLDIYALKPLRTHAGYLVGWASETLINGAVLTLPKSSATLADLIEFCDEQFPIPPFDRTPRRIRYRLMKAIGRPVHISQQKWGTWGPNALTWFMKKNKETEHVLPRESLYPIYWTHPDQLFLPSNQVKDMYLKDASCVHLFAATTRKKINEIGLDNIPKGSYLGQLIKIGNS